MEKQQKTWIKFSSTDSNHSEKLIRGKEPIGPGVLKVVQHWLLTSLIVDIEHEDVHGAHLGELMVLAVEPEHLLEPAGGSLLLYVDGGCIVGAHFAIAHAAGPGARVSGIGEQGDSAIAASLEVAAHRAEYGVEQRRVG